MIILPLLREPESLHSSFDILFFALPTSLEDLLEVDEVEATLEPKLVKSLWILSPLSETFKKLFETSPQDSSNFLLICLLVPWEDCFDFLMRSRCFIYACSIRSFFKNIGVLHLLVLFCFWRFVWSSFLTLLNSSMELSLKSYSLIM